MYMYCSSRPRLDLTVSKEVFLQVHDYLAIRVQNSMLSVEQSVYVLFSR